MIFKEEQSLHTRFGKSSVWEYSPRARRMATSTGQDTAKKGQKIDPFSYDLLDHLARIPTKVSLLDLLKLNKPSRIALVHMLEGMDGPIRNQQVLQLEQAMKRVANVKESAITATLLTIPITFEEEDLLLKSTEHNRPLYFTAYVHEASVPRIQIDSGSSINKY